MTDVAKLFQSGGSQAVRLPKKYRFEGGDEVAIHREGHRIVLEPFPKSWSRDFLELAASAADFPYPQEPPEVEPLAALDEE